MKRAYSNQIRTERATHHGKKVIKLIFGIDTYLNSLIKQIESAQWSRTMHCWLIPDKAQSAKTLREKIDIEVSQTNNVPASIQVGVQISPPSPPTVSRANHKIEPLLLRFPTI
jgi:hypothetical protein